MQEIAKTNKPYVYSGSSFIKKYSYIWAFILIIVFTVLYQNIKSNNKQTICNQKPIDLVFYQPLLKDKMDWERTFQKLQQAGVKTIILQWSKFGVVDFIQKDRWLSTILSSAQKYHIDVIVGLYGDDKYFKTLENKHIKVEKYLNSLYTQNILQAKKIYAIAKKYDSFYGYYIYDEIDDTNFVDIKRQTYLKKYLKKMAYSIERISTHPLYISSYFSKNMSIDKYTNFMSNITDHKYTLLLQSGIGANLVNAKESAKYIESFSKNFKGDFIPIVESFKMNKSKIEAIDIESLNRQIDILKSANSSKIALFSLRYFLEEELFSNYILKKSTIR